MNGECEGATNRARFCSHHVVTREVSARTDQMNGPFGYCTTAQIFNTSVSCSARNQRGAVHNDAEYTPTGVYRRGTGSLEKQRAQARVCICIASIATIRVDEAAKMHHRTFGLLHLLFETESSSPY